MGADTYAETLIQAYLTSFLVSYGYADLKVHPLEEKMYLYPYEKKNSKKDTPSFSFPISVSYEAWKRWQEGKED